MVASILSSPEVLWSAIVAGVTGVGATGAKVLHLHHKVETLEEELDDTKSDVKEDLKYLRDRMDKVFEYLMETEPNV